MRMQVQKWGSSLALRIPKPFAEDVDVQEGTIGDLSVSKGQCVVAPVRYRKVWPSDKTPYSKKSSSSLMAASIFFSTSTGQRCNR